MSDRTLRRLRSLGWFALVVGIVAFTVGTDRASAGWMAWASR